MLGTSQKKPCGLLNVKSIHDKFTLDLYLPSEDLDTYVEHYWIVKWDLRGQEPYVSETLPHPSIHFTVEPDQSWVTGVIKKKFARSLQDEGFVFGIKFHPGAYYPFTSKPVHKLTGLVVPALEELGPDVTLFADAIKALGIGKEEHMVQLAEAFLLGRLPKKDPTVAFIRSIVDRVRTDRKITAVEDIAAEFHLTVRMLQRMFSKYVGVSPKWVIKRYRLLEVAGKLAEGPPGSWPSLAAELGYYDQSHFIKDFKSIIGVSPEEYVRNNEPAPG